MGFAIVPVGVACLVGPPISGAILGSSYAWWKGVVFASVSFADDTILLVLLTVSHAQVTDTVPCVFLAAALYILRRNAKAKARVQSPTGA